MRIAAVVVTFLLLMVPFGGLASELSILAKAGSAVVNLPSQPVSLVVVQPAGPPMQPVPVSGAVTDLQRFELALNAGWNAADAVIATAISIAENGAGIPTLASPQNKNGSFDYCLWQVNSSWFYMFPQQWLSDPQNCANAAFYIWQHGGWNRWCTYPGGCGGGPGAANWPQALARARAVAGGH